MRAAVDQALNRVRKLHDAAGEEGHKGIRVGLAGAFLLGVLASIALVAGGVTGSAAVIVAAGVIGGYMALNIGANDVANNMGPAVGSRALTMLGALVIAAVFETAGAIIAGGDVVSTVAKGIIDPAPIAEIADFVTAMMAALLAAALWLNLATYVGAPVSTTHAIVGGVMGAGIAAIGMASVNWLTMSKIAASWVISPVMGGVIAALFLSLIRRTIFGRQDRIAAARRWVPILVGIMAGAFAMYLMIKGLSRIWQPDIQWVLVAGVAVFGATWVAVTPLVASASEGLDGRKKSVQGLFTVPLACAAALLSFAHGANDVANAVGPLAAVVGALTSSGGVGAPVGIPLWVLVVGAVGISVGLVLFGPRLIRTVGEKITKLTPVRAFCVALSAAITVLVASALGLPVSSTHIAVGGVFGVGFLREALHNKLRTRRLDALSDETLAAAVAASADGEVLIDGAPAPPKKKKKRKRNRRLVRRKHMATIVAAWLVTVPLAAALAALLYVVLHWGRTTFF